MKFEDAQDVAYRFAQALYFRKLKKLLGEDGVRQIADTQSRHTAILVVGDCAIPIQVTISSGRVFKVDNLEDAIKQANAIKLPDSA